MHFGHRQLAKLNVRSAGIEDPKGYEPILVYGIVH